MTARLVRVVLVMTLLSSWATEAAVAQGDPPPPTSASTAALGADPSPVGEAAEQAPTMWLRGPFGKVAGGTLGRPATAPPLDLPLDAFVRQAPLLLEMDDAALVSRVEVVARPVGGSGEPQVLARGQAAFEGPSRPGPQLIVATAAMDEGVIERAWLVDVPDRDPPADGIYDLPAPAIEVATSLGRQEGTLGDGCYVYLCVETGRDTPPRELDPLAASVGETPALSLLDGSALVAWEGSLTPIGGTAGEPRTAAGVVTEAPVSSIALAGLEPAGPGDWLLEVEVVLDRERGWLRTAYRLVVE